MCEWDRKIFQWSEFSKKKNWEEHNSFYKGEIKMAPFTWYDLS